MGQALVNDVRQTVATAAAPDDGCRGGAHPHDGADDHGSGWRCGVVGQLQSCREVTDGRECADLCHSRHGCPGHTEDKEPTCTGRQRSLPFSSSPGDDTRSFGSCAAASRPDSSVMMRSAFSNASCRWSARMMVHFPLRECTASSMMLAQARRRVRPWAHRAGARQDRRPSSEPDTTAAFLLLTANGYRREPSDSPGAGPRARRECLLPSLPACSRLHSPLGEPDAGSRQQCSEAGTVSATMPQSLRPPHR